MTLQEATWLENLAASEATHTNKPMCLSSDID